MSFVCEVLTQHENQHVRAHTYVHNSTQCTPASSEALSLSLHNYYIFLVTTQGPKPVYTLYIARWSIHLSIASPPGSPIFLNVRERDWEWPGNEAISVHRVCSVVWKVRPLSGIDHYFFQCFTYFTQSTIMPDWLLMCILHQQTGHIVHSIP